MSPVGRTQLIQQVEELQASFYTVDRLTFRNDVKEFLEGSPTPVEKLAHEPIESEMQDVRQKRTVPGSTDYYSHLNNLGQLINVHQVRPEAEDFMEDMINLGGRITLPESDIHETIKAVIDEKITLKEREANLLLADYVNKFGRHPLVHAACREYFTSELLNLQQIYWRPDPRGHRIRMQAQEICSQALSRIPWLTPIEKRILVHATGCYPQDAETFWRDITRNRLSFLAVETIKHKKKRENRLLPEMSDSSYTNTLND